MRLSVSALRSLTAAALTTIYTVSFIGVASSPATATPQQLYSLALPNGAHAVVYRNGQVEITGKEPDDKTFSLLPFSKAQDEIYPDAGLPEKTRLAFELTKNSPAHPWVDGRLIVVLRDGVSTSSDTVKVAATRLHALTIRAVGTTASASLTPAYTNDFSLNRALATMGTAQMSRLFGHVSRSSLSSMRAAAQQASGRPLLNVANAYRLDITNMPINKAVMQLLKSPAVVYASPDWRVGSMESRSIVIPHSVTAAAASRSLRADRRLMTGRVPGASTLPPNYALANSAQSMLNAPSNNAATPFDLIKNAYGQLPGQGEIITNVSLGDVDDGSETDPLCQSFASSYGPSTSLIGGQRYINWPSMPLIPAYVSDINGNLFGSGPGVCGVDPFLQEIGLDFSMMAPLPHANQRAGEVGAGYTDLLGIAPGAAYRLVVPLSLQDTGATDIDAAFLAAAAQNPHPNVITASLGFSIDQDGFSSRYLEDDPLTQAVIASIVTNYNTVVCISSGDGTRLFTNVAVGPSGGSVPTNRLSAGGTPTNLNDVAFSTTPSLDFDSGSIDAGGTTLDDIYAAPPQFPAFRGLASQHAFPETRYTGFTSFSSGFGSRVDVSAPSDNVLAFAHRGGGAADAVDVLLQGGTSASAPEVAAAAAVVLQMGRLTRHPFQNAFDVRKFLRDTATAVPGTSQSDVYNQVGPQINVGNAVEALLKNSGHVVKPAVGRVAIEQRRNFAVIGGFLGDTDPTNIDLQGPVSSVDGTNTDRNEKAWITMAPDWEGIPAGARYELTIAGHPRPVLATTPWARILPENLLHAAGFTLASPLQRTVTLTYRAFQGMHTFAESTFSLTFGAADPTTRASLAPIVPSQVSGPTIPVTYDLTNVRNVLNPTLLVSSAGRVNPSTGLFFYPAYSMPLPQLSGTVQVPVSALQGGGIYGIGINYGSINGNALYSDFAYTRVGQASTMPIVTARPPAPLLSSSDAAPGHSLQLNYAQPFDVSWDARNVTGATGAALEISAPGPNGYFNLNPFNNPNGSKRDRNGIDSGSVAFIPLSGLAGTKRIDPVQAGVLPTFNHVVRIVATNGGVKVGEAGDVSTLSMNGVVTADGGSPGLGFAINRQGNDGLITSRQFVQGSVFSSLQSFDQTTNQITKTIVTDFADANGVPEYELLGGGLYKNDVSLALKVLAFIPPYSTFSESAVVINPVTGGAITSPWTTPVNQSLNYGIGAPDDVDTKPAFLSRGYTFDTHPNGFTGRWYVFQTDILANTIGPSYDITDMDPGCPFFYQFGQNTTTNTAVISNACGDLVVLNMTDGSHKVISNPGTTTMGLAVDSTTNKVAVTTVQGDALTIYDLNNNTSKQVQTPGNVDDREFGATIGVDEVHHLFVVLQPHAGDARDNVVLSSMLTYDENGRLLKSNHSFNRARFNFRLSRNMLQLTPATRTGFVMDNGQLQSFKY